MRLESRVGHTRTRARNLEARVPEGGRIRRRVQFWDPRLQILLSKLTLRVSRALGPAYFHFRDWPTVNLPQRLELWSISKFHGTGSCAW